MQLAALLLAFPIACHAAALTTKSSEHAACPTVTTTVKPSLCPATATTNPKSTGLAKPSCPVVPNCFLVSRVEVPCGCPTAFARKTQTLGCDKPCAVGCETSYSTVTPSTKCPEPTKSAHGKGKGKGRKVHTKTVTKIETITSDGIVRTTTYTTKIHKTHKSKSKSKSTTHHTDTKKSHMTKSTTTKKPETTTTKR